MSNPANHPKTSISKPRNIEMMGDRTFNSPPRRAPPLASRQPAQLSQQSTKAVTSTGSTQAARNPSSTASTPFLHRTPRPSPNSSVTSLVPLGDNTGMVSRRPSQCAPASRQYKEEEKAVKQPSLVRRMFSYPENSELATRYTKENNYGQRPSVVRWNTEDRSSTDSAASQEKKPSLIKRIVSRTSDDHLTSERRTGKHGRNVSRGSAADSIEGRTKPPSLIQRTRRLSNEFMSNVSQRISSTAQDIKRSFIANPAVADKHRLNVHLQSSEHRQAQSRRHANHGSLRRVASASQLVPSAPVPLVWDYGENNVWAQSQRLERAEQAGGAMGFSPFAKAKGASRPEPAPPSLRSQSGAPSSGPASAAKALPPIPAMSKRHPDMGPERPDSLVSSIYSEIPHDEERIRTRAPVAQVMDGLQSYKNTNIPARLRERWAIDKSNASEMRKVAAPRAVEARTSIAAGSMRGVYNQAEQVITVELKVSTPTQYTSKFGDSATPKTASTKIPAAHAPKANEPHAQRFMPVDYRSPDQSLPASPSIFAQDLPDDKSPLCDAWKDDEDNDDEASHYEDDDTMGHVVALERKLRRRASCSDIFSGEESTVDGYLEAAPLGKSQRLWEKVMEDARLNKERQARVVSWATSAKILPAVQPLNVAKRGYEYGAHQGQDAVVIAPPVEDDARSASTVRVAKGPHETSRAPTPTAPSRSQARPAATSSSARTSPNLAREVRTASPTIAPKRSHGPSSLSQSAKPVPRPAGATATASASRVAVVPSRRTDELRHDERYNHQRTSSDPEKRARRENAVMDAASGDLRRNHSASSSTAGTVRRALQKSHPRDDEASQVSWYAMEQTSVGYSVKVVNDDEQAHRKSTHAVVEGSHRSHRREHGSSSRR